MECYKIKMKLKTLKDIDVFKTESSILILENYRMTIKKETIKWVDEYRFKHGVEPISLIEFMNITEADLK